MRKFILTSSIFLFVLFSLSYFIKINILSSIFYGSVVSFLNCIGINLVTKMFLNMINKNDHQFIIVNALLIRLARVQRLPHASRSPGFPRRRTQQQQ